jgi:hypothetical protein
MMPVWLSSVTERPSVAGIVVVVAPGTAVVVVVGSLPNFDDGTQSSFEALVVTDF